MDLIGALKGLALPGKSAINVLELDMARGVLAAMPDNPFEALKALHATTLPAIREGLRHARTEDSVRGLVVHVAESGLSVAELQELAQCIEDFAAHKPTIAWAQSFGELASGMSSYVVATAAQEIWLQPSGQLSLLGAHLQITLLRGLLEKGGIEPQFGKRHEYKTAADQFSAPEVSDANREMMQRIADSLVEQSVALIARRRKLDEAVVRQAMDESPLTPERALELGLVDHIGYRDEVYDHLYEAWQATPRTLHFVSRYEAKHLRPARAMEALDRKAPVIGMIQLKGAIVTGRGTPAGGPGGAQVGGDAIDEHLRAACRDDRVKAVVLKIDSPGGSAVASDTIWRAIHRVRESGRPVVAAMGSVAASGGYYSAMAADEIVALPSTLTGSIGVLAGKMVTNGLYDKLDLKREGIDSGRRAAMFASDRQFSEEDWEVLNTWLDRIYDQFTSKAAADRKMDHAELEKLARGRVWTGADALDRGLVDHLGGTDLALDRACALIGAERKDVQLKVLPMLGPFDRLRPAESSESSGFAASVRTTGPEALLTRALHVLGWDPAVYAGPLMMPYRITVN